MLIIAVAIAVIDIYASIKGGDHDTISGRIWDWSKEYPMLPFCFGVLAGHLFWQENKK
jgi:hypothetical protein